HYMGGGFGSKFGAHHSGLLAAYAARRLGVPGRHMLSREDENLCAGNPPATTQTYRLAAKRDGTLTATALSPVVNVGAAGSWFSPVALAPKELYRCPHVRTVDYAVRTNLGTQSAVRAPGVVEGMSGLEVAMDELARAVGMDSLELRHRNDTD